MGRKGTGDGVAAALDSDGLRRLEAGRRLLAELQAAYEAAEAVEERGRVARAALLLGDPDEEGPGGLLSLISGMLDGSLRSSPLFDVSDLARRLEVEQARCVLFAAAAWLASGTAGYFSFAELISSELAGRDLEMTPSDVLLLAAVSAPSEDVPDIGVTVVAYQPFDLMLDNVERLLATGAPGAAELAEAVAAQTAWWKVKAVNRYWQRVDFQPRIADLRERALALAGYPLPVPPGCLVRLVHPVLLDAAGLERLRSLAAGLRIEQPVRQLWRETFRVCAAERESGAESARYAGHVLRFKQCYGLARSRGWGGGFLYAGYDGGQDAIARKGYPGAGLRASWALEEADMSGPLGPGGPYDTGGPTVELCLTGKIAFSALDDVIPVPIPLADVPSEVFSETMRDIDLIVSAATVANDPAWIERHHGRQLLDAYWDRMAAGGTDSLRAARREVLASVYGTPGDRYTLTTRTWRSAARSPATGSTLPPRTCGWSRPASGCPLTASPRRQPASAHGGRCRRWMTTRYCNASWSAPPSSPTMNCWPAASYCGRSEGSARRADGERVPLQSSMRLSEVRLAGLAG